MKVTHKVDETPEPMRPARVFELKAEFSVVHECAVGIAYVVT
jgi:hypothetical protein